MTLELLPSERIPALAGPVLLVVMDGVGIGPGYGRGSHATLKSRCWARWRHPTGTTATIGDVRASAEPGGRAKHPSNGARASASSEEPSRAE